MSTTSPALHHLARQLLAGMAAGVEPPSGEADQAVRACEQLRGPLTKLAGTAGFSSLLSRAVVLAQRQAPELEGLRVGADGTLEGLHETPQDRKAVQAAQRGGVILIAELLSLLVTLIGEPLTLQLVREAWPKKSLETLTLQSEEPL